MIAYVVECRDTSHQLCNPTQLHYWAMNGKMTAFNGLTTVDRDKPQLCQLTERSSEPSLNETVRAYDSDDLRRRRDIVGLGGRIKSVAFA